MFALVIHFPYSTIKIKERMSATDIISFEQIMLAHNFTKTLSKITIDTNNSIAMLVYDIWYDEELK